jgi:hypothetical protein
MPDLSMDTDRQKPSPIPMQILAQHVLTSIIPHLIGHQIDAVHRETLEGIKDIGHT